MEKKIDKTLINYMIISVIFVLKLVTNHNIFVIINCIFIGICILKEKQERKAKYLFFVVPWSSTFKFSSDGLSFYTLIALIYVLSTILNFIKNKNNKIHIKPIMFLLGMLVILLINNISLDGNSSSILFIIGWILNFIVAYFIVISIENKEDISRYTNSYIISILISGIFVFILSYVPSIKNNLYQYINIFEMNIGGLDVYRFTGLESDPNFYATQLITLIAITLKKLSNKKDYIVFVLLLIIGILTLSKTFILLLALLLLLGVITSTKDIKFKNIVYIFIAGMIIVIACPQIAEVYNTRLTSYDNINDFTTGRYDLWKEYAKEIITNFRTLLIGNGVNASYLYISDLKMNKGAHNSYLYIIYEMGIIGALFYILFFRELYKYLKKKLQIDNRIKFVNFLPLIILLCASFSLDLINMDWMIYLLIIVIINTVT